MNPVAETPDTDLIYTVENGKVTITGCDQNAVEVTIPETLEGHPVTSIGSNAFSNCTDLTSISIPPSVSSIDSSAFVNCTQLSEITVDPNNTDYTSDQGVLFNKDKTAIICYPAGKTETVYEIPSVVTQIEENAFNGCVNLTNVSIPSM